MWRGGTRFVQIYFQYELPVSTPLWVVLFSAFWQHLVETHPSLCVSPSSSGSMELCSHWNMLLFLLGTLLTAHSPTPVAPHAVTVPTYRAPGTPTYSYVPPQWWSHANVSDWRSLGRLLTKVHFFQWRMTSLPQFKHEWEKCCMTVDPRAIWCLNFCSYWDCTK